MAGEQAHTIQDRRKPQFIERLICLRIDGVGWRNLWFILQSQTTQTSGVALLFLNTTLHRIRFTDFRKLRAKECWEGFCALALERRAGSGKLVPA